MALVFFGQFIDHDLASTQATEIPDTIVFGSLPYLNFILIGQLLQVLSNQNKRHVYTSYHYVAYII